MNIGLDATARDWNTLHSSFRWNVPARYNIAQACCGRWAEDRTRFALYYEDEAGHTEAWSFWDVQQAANRLSNVLGAMGVMDRLAAELPVGLQVTELADAGRTRERLIATGRQLVNDHGAHVVVMGCAGMAQYRKALEDAIGVPVVEPTQAAAGMALARVRLAGV